MRRGGSVDAKRGSTRQAGWDLLAGMECQDIDIVRGRDFEAPACGAEDWEPGDAGRRKNWKRLRPETRRERFEEALRRLCALREVVGRPAEESERRAIRRVVTWAHRSSFRRWQARSARPRGCA